MCCRQQCLPVDGIVVRGGPETEEKKSVGGYNCLLRTKFDGACRNYGYSAVKHDVEKFERKTGEKIFIGEINGQKVTKGNRSSFNC